MALFLLAVKTVSRAKQGATMVRGAAYRSGTVLREYDREPGTSVASAAHLAGERLTDDRSGVAHDFRGKAVVHSEVVLPHGAPERFRDRETLWNAVEAAESRVNSRVGRELLVALPRELSAAENLELVRSFVAESLVARGMCADFAIHSPTASDGLKQPHVHVLTNTRAVGPDGFGAKVRDWDRRELVMALRAEWADQCNRALEHAGRVERVDHRSLEVQCREALERGDFDRAAELDREPGVHLGPAAHAMERDGIRTEIGDELRAIEAVNSSRAQTYAAVRQMAAEVSEAAARFMELRREAADVFDAFASWCGWAETALDRLRELAASLAEGAREVVGAAWDLVRPMSDAEMDELVADLEREDERERVTEREDRDHGIELEA